MDRVEREAEGHVTGLLAALELGKLGSECAAHCSFEHRPCLPCSRLASLFRVQGLVADDKKCPPLHHHTMALFLALKIRLKTSRYRLPYCPAVMSSNTSASYNQIGLIKYMTQSHIYRLDMQKSANQAYSPTSRLDLN